MRILIAEDSTLLREALTALVERLDHVVVATAQTATELETEYARLNDADTPPDLIITDVRMPPTNTSDGLLAALSIRAEHPRQPIMVLSQYLADTNARRLLTLPKGAVGYLLKDRVNRVRDFARSLDSVANGGTVIDPEVVQHLLSTAGNGPLDSLTPREHEVLGLMADGHSNSVIASKLVLSDPAVSKHIGNIFQKLNLDPVDENRRVKAVLTYLNASRS
ncbi:response regulator transcription factor [Brevibacterium sp. 50QC2O2]|uniref:response regulator transcription factor n=1 Tax=unclassified Brevibacterium TaxID=2614124 RepID=UPI00211B8F01|nr:MULTISPECIES: response regulator transcription factor [unclassified Brevibacterium]MCQ9367597.1 response regulator transcription factor [Brevibacterium sp. 91QC2O2]MCQ9389043.1 response regulator transcription factor [Brevibacterium sp. 50QC2O2]